MSVTDPTTDRFRVLSRRSVVALALWAAATGAAAQSAPQPLDSVIVTGTRAKSRTQLNAPVPVDVYTQDDLRRAGVLGGELGQALSVLQPAFNFPRQSNSGGSDHVRAAQLRGLSPDQVLVLINGKRRHTSAVVNVGTKIGKGTAPVDFNSIPVSAIKRIEVLRDGAGAQYGSDAIAGVINVILNDADEGASASISYGAHHTRVAPIDGTTAKPWLPMPRQASSSAWMAFCAWASNTRIAMPTIAPDSTRFRFSRSSRRRIWRWPVA